MPQGEGGMVVMVKVVWECCRSNCKTMLINSRGM